MSRVGVNGCGLCGRCVCGCGADWVDGDSVGRSRVRGHGTDGVDGDWISRGGLRGYGTGWDGDGVSGRSAHGVDGGNGGGIDGDGIGGHRVREHGVDGVDGDVTWDWVGGGNGGGIDGDGVGGHRVHERGANGVYSDIAGGWVDWSGGGIGWFGLQGVVGDGAEAVRLIDLCCPVEPHGFVRLRVGSYAGCGRWGGVSYLALGDFCPLLFSCIYLLFSHSFLLSPLFFSPHSQLLLVLSYSRRHGVTQVCGCGRGGQVDLRLGWDKRWQGDDVLLRRCCSLVGCWGGCVCRRGNGRGGRGGGLA
jgi:hypothetical protein